MVDQYTLTDAVGNPLLPLDVEDKHYFIRQPAPEEYDDASNLQTFTYRKTLTLPHIQDVADTPCSAGERALFERIIADTQARFDALDPETQGAQKQALAEELARLQMTLDGRTLAQETAWDQAILARDRWLTMRLLCDEHGKPYFDTRAKDFPAKWAKLPLKVKDAARPVIWHAWALVSEAPFS